MLCQYERPVSVIGVQYFCLYQCSTNVVSYPVFFVEMGLHKRHYCFAQIVTWLICSIMTSRKET